ncbi:hypothetical protein [Actinobaculum massiliense]|nr:hypothetical protein [Actinobaculum massiliense]MDK8566813.1 hypothetical protein [Actinobaculum massiliense]
MPVGLVAIPAVSVGVMAVTIRAALRELDTELAHGAEQRAN